ncbi:MAG TPA: transposase, partial [Bacteriovoracaceae bacterium]|nr:transposase [Bacteriovoracaceae bacterium]
MDIAISNVFGVAGRKVLMAIIEGEKDPEVLTKLVDTNVKAKKEVIRKSLNHTLDEINLYMYSQLLYLEHLAQELEKKINDMMDPYDKFIKKLDEIPGIDKITAQIIIAEATTDMENFKDAKAFAAWAGVA